MSIDKDWWIRELLKNAKKRAKNHGTPFRLTYGEVLEMWRRQQGRCAVTGIEFTEEWCGCRSRRPWIPSLDRRNSQRGYTVKNTRLVVYAANAAMNEWGVSVLDQLALGRIGLLYRAACGHRERYGDGEV
jgi:hypothetical protein